MVALVKAFIPPIRPPQPPPLFDGARLDRLLSSAGPALRCWVSGIPRPQGSKRAFTTKTGKTVLVESSKLLAPWRQELAAMARQAAQAAEWKLPDEVALRVLFLVPRPASHLNTSGGLRKSAPRRPTGKPDLSKLVRAAEDALSGIAYSDDARIVTLSAHKRFTRGEPGAFFIVEPAHEHIEWDLFDDAAHGTPSQVEL